MPRTAGVAQRPSGTIDCDATTRREQANLTCPCCLPENVYHSLRRREASGRALVPLVLLNMLLLAVGEASAVISIVPIVTGCNIRV